MIGSPPKPSPAGLIATVLGLVFIVLLLDAFSTAGLATGPPLTSPVGTSSNWVLAGGLATVGTAQNITGTPSWETYCPSSQGACMAPVGLAIVPASQEVILTQVTGYPGGVNAVTEFNPNTLQISPNLPLPCSPEVPFYPGTGVNVFVPCLNSVSDSDGRLFVVSSQNLSIVANISMPALTSYQSSMTYDPSNGFAYLSVNSSQIAAVDPVHDTAEGVMDVAGAALSTNAAEGAYVLVFDPFTGQLLLPSASNGILGVDPADGSQEAFVPLPSTVVALSIDAATNQLFATTFDPSTLDVFDASNYRLEAQFSIPNCINNICGEPNDIPQVVIDPTHGDAYLAAVSFLLTLNLTTLSIVSAIEANWNGPATSMVYTPVTDRVFGTYEAEHVGPGFLVELNHRGYPVVTTLLWLPTTLGILLLSAVAGAGSALFFAGAARRARRRDGGPAPQLPRRGRDFFRRSS